MCRYTIKQVDYRECNDFMFVLYKVQNENEIYKVGVKNYSDLIELTFVLNDQNDEMRSFLIPFSTFPLPTEQFKDLKQQLQEHIADEESFLVSITGGDLPF